MDNDVTKRVMNAVDKRFEEQTAFLSELASHPSTRGFEQSAQRFMADQLLELGYATDSWEIKVADIAHLPGFSPVIGDYDDALNVVGTHRSRSGRGKSLILNGHIDVVPVGPLDMWDSPPFAPRIDGGFMYGRGVGDMKAGLVANLYALNALRDIGYQPAADVHFQSVVEEECTGNGMLACFQRGYRADAALIPEPFAEQLVSAQIGVIWFQVHLKGKPVHVLEAGSGFNAIEASLPLIAALKALEVRWNRPGHAHPHYRHHEHPLNLNIGKIQGGDWASSVPAWCSVDVRMGIYPGQDINAARAEIEACLNEAADADVYLRTNRPAIIYNGFLAEGYCLADHDKPETRQAISTLENAHFAVTGDALKQAAITATTDARFPGLYWDIPSLVYGPAADSIHGFNERVDLESVRRVTQSIAVFIAGWCGLEKV
ncbi:MAG TPA: ArgE/DapE family deacylase [Xanthomonadales bacterium]